MFQSDKLIKERSKILLEFIICAIVLSFIIANSSREEFSLIMLLYFLPIVVLGLTISIFMMKVYCLVVMKCFKVKNVIYRDISKHLNRYIIKVYLLTNTIVTCINFCFNNSYLTTILDILFKAIISFLIYYWVLPEYNIDKKKRVIIAIILLVLFFIAI